MCICSFLPSVSSISVCRSFLLTYSIRSRLSLQLPLSSLNLFSLFTCCLVMNALFNCFVLCLLYLLPPPPPNTLFCFVCILLFCFSRRHFMLFSLQYGTMIAIVTIVLTSSFLAKFVLFLSVRNFYHGQVARQAFVP